MILCSSLDRRSDGLTILWLQQVQQKILENGDTAADDDEIAPTVLVQVGI